MSMRMHIMSDNGLTSRMYAEQHIQRTGKHTKRWSALLLIRKCRPNPELVHRTSMKVAIMKNQATAGFDKEVEKLESLHIVSGNVQQYSIP